MRKSRMRASASASLASKPRICSSRNCLACAESLRDAPRLAQLNPDSDEYHFLKTQLVRNRNAVSFALRQALEVFA